MCAIGETERTPLQVSRTIRHFDAGFVAGSIDIFLPPSAAFC